MKAPSLPERLLRAFCFAVVSFSILVMTIVIPPMVLFGLFYQQNSGIMTIVLLFCLSSFLMSGLLVLNARYFLMWFANLMFPWATPLKWPKSSSEKN